MIKSFDATANLVLSSVIDRIESSLRCPKYDQLTNRIEIHLTDDVSFKMLQNKELVEKGFGACLFRSYNYGIGEVFIVVNMKNCKQANLTEREIAAIIFHELGHILNEPALQDEPTFEFCFIQGIEFNKESLEKVQESNNITKEIFADSYANKHGYGEELISTFHKQIKTFKQKIEYYSTRIEKIQNIEYFEGNIMSPNNDK